MKIVETKIDAISISTTYSTTAFPACLSFCRTALHVAFFISSPEEPEAIELMLKVTDDLRNPPRERLVSWNRALGCLTNSDKWAKDRPGT